MGFFSALLCAYIFSTILLTLQGQTGHKGIQLYWGGEKRQSGGLCVFVDAKGQGLASTYEELANSDVTLHCIVKGTYDSCDNCCNNKGQRMATGSPQHTNVVSPCSEAHHHLLSLRPWYTKHISVVSISVIRMYLMHGKVKTNKHFYVTNVHCDMFIFHFTMCKIHTIKERNLASICWFYCTLQALKTIHQPVNCK